MPFAPVFQLSSLNGTNGFQINGEAAFDQSGWSVASAGDVNGDGFDDLIIGAPFAAPYGGINSGSSYVIFGQGSSFSATLSLSDLDGVNGFRITGASTLDHTGFSVASAGDVNADGFDDLIIGSPYGGADAGAAYVVFGKASGFQDSRNIIMFYDYEATRFYGGAVGDAAGWSVATAGDINGDGYDDVVVGARFADPNGLTNAGAAYVVFGQVVSLDDDLFLGQLDGVSGFKITGEAAFDLIGASVASAGDVNGDGYGDLILGTSDASPAGGQSGATYVVFGKASGFAAELNLASLDGTDGFQISGEQSGDLSGYSVASAGDINGDGYDDLVIGAFGTFQHGPNSGSSYVVFGKASGFAADVSLSSLDGENGFKISGTAALDELGRSVASAGDFNNDGYDDLIIGAPNASSNGGISGASYVVFGRSSGFAHLQPSALNGLNGFRIDGDPFDASGGSVAPAGDINNDGYDDLIIGARFADEGGANSGASYVVFGGPSGHFTGGGLDDSHTGDGTHESFTGGGGKDVLDGAGGNDLIDGSDGNDILNGGDGADDLMGGRGNDILIGGAGNDVLSDASGSNKLNGGDGDDVLTGSGGADRLNGEGDDDTLDGRAGNDYLDGGTGTNSLAGGAGNDIFIVRSAGDTVIENVGEGTDTVRSMVSYTLRDNVEVLELLTGTDIDGTGNALGNTLKGNGGASTLSGLAGADKLDGGAGADILIGGTHRDTLTGGTGADTFRVLSESVGLPTLEIDTVTDYQAGTDLLDFSLIDADGDAGNGDTAFSVSLTGLTKVAGQLYVFYTATVGVGGTTTVRLDVNGDGKADYQMALQGGDFTADAVNWLL